MRVDIIDSRDALLSLRENWDSVYEQDPEAHFFLSWVWLSGLLGNDGSQWFILAAAPETEGEDYAAFFPLRLKTKKKVKGKGFINEIGLAGRTLSDYTGFLCAPEHEAEAIGAFAHHLKQRSWASLDLECFRASKRRIDLFFRYFPKQSFVISDHESPKNRDGIDNNICPYVSLPDDWDAYLSDLNSNTRQKARRFLRKIENSGQFRITVADADTIERDIKILLRLWRMKWGDRKGKRLEVILRNNFKMLLRCFKDGALFLPVLWQDDRPLVAHANFIDRAKATLLFMIGGRDDSFRGPPPTGFVLHTWSIRHAIGEGYAIYDFLRGNEAYKYLFGPNEHYLRNIVVSTKNGCNLGRKLDEMCLPRVLQWSHKSHEAGRLTDAEDGYRQILKIDPRSAGALYGLGQIMAQRGDHRAAAQAFQRLTSVRPEAAKAWLRLGEAFEARKRFSDAAKAYGKLVECTPDIPAAYLYLGRMLKELGRFKEADAAFETATALNGKS